MGIHRTPLKTARAQIHLDLRQFRGASTSTVMFLGGRRISQNLKKTHMGMNSNKKFHKNSKVNSGLSR